MTEKRVQFSNIVKNQLPAYVREEFPLISEFLSQYYISQEFKGAPVDLIQNIDQYVKVDELTNNTEYLYLNSDITDIDTTINVDVGLNNQGTSDFPDSYGLIQIDDEIMLVTRVSGGEIYVKRALFGTRISEHPNQSAIKRIKILPVELVL